VNTVKLVARVQGYLQEIKYQDGATMKKGTPLFVIEPQPYKVKLEQAQAAEEGAKATLINAEAEFTRQQELQAKDVSTQANLDRARANRDTARANVLQAQANTESAEINFGYTTVSAPFDGVVTARKVSVGELVGGDQPNQLASIVQLDPIWVWFNLSERDVQRVRAAMAERGVTAADFVNKVPVEVGLQTETWSEGRSAAFDRESRGHGARHQFGRSQLTACRDLEVLHPASGPGERARRPDDRHRRRRLAAAAGRAISQCRSANYFRHHALSRCWRARRCRHRRLADRAQVNGVDGMIYMQSWSASDGSYTLIVTFKIGMDINFAQVLVQNRVSSALAQLPQAVQAQGVTVQQKSTAVLLFVTLTSPNSSYDSLFLANYATINLQPELARLPGVGQVNIFGAGQYSMRVWLDPNRLYALSLTTEDVVNALKGQNQQVTAGQLGMPPAPSNQAFQYTLDIATRLDQVDQFENIAVKTEQDGRMVHLRDVARIELGAQTYSQMFTVNGKPAAGIGIYQTLEANALTVAGAVKAKMDQLAKSFPPGLAYSIPFDTTTFVRASINEVWKTLFEAAILVLIVIVVFLQDWRAMLVPMTTVPVTIIGAFAAMAALGFTVNLSTLLAIVLAIGIVVVDAIVVVEGAAHNIERGMPGKQAAIQTMNELFGPIIGITLVLMAVFLPAAFIPGLTGKMFAQFALVIAATALLSAINAATLKPTQCALWLRPPVPPGERNLLFRAFNTLYDPFERGYARLIGGMVARSGAMCVIALIVIGAAGYGLSRIPTGFLPIEDQGYVLVTVQLPTALRCCAPSACLTRSATLQARTPRSRT
jgi:biotin carboxyl carrier protein